MQAGLVLLCLAYVLSQFFRAFLAVLTGALAQDIGAGPDDLATAVGLARVLAKQNGSIEDMTTVSTALYASVDV